MPADRRVFMRIHATNYWRSPETLSGVGSELGRTVQVRTWLPALLQQLQVRSLLDAGCGDFNWMQHVDLEGVHYTGVDLVPALVEQLQQLHGGPGREFYQADICTDWMPQADLVLCRTVLFHLCHEHALQALRNLQTRGAWLLATTYPDWPANDDITDGDWRRVNLCRPPYDLPAPEALYPEDQPRWEGDPHAGSMGLWRLPLGL
jgi:SAM-dependent methyltransferase